LAIWAYFEVPPIESLGVNPLSIAILFPTHFKVHVNCPIEVLFRYIQNTNALTNEFLILGHNKALPNKIDED